MKTQTTKTLKLTVIAVLAVCVAVLPPLTAQEKKWDGKHVRLILFDVPDAGTGAGQGTFPFVIKPAG